MPTAQEYLDKRTNAITNYHTLSSKIKGEKREPTPAENDELAGWEKQADENKKLYDDQWSKEKRDEKMAQAHNELDLRAGGRRSQSDNPNRDITDLNIRKAIEWNSMKDLQPAERFRKHNNRRLRTSKSMKLPSQDIFNYHLVPDNLKRMYLEEIGEQSSATTLQTDDDVRAGYTVPSETFMEGLLRNVDDETWIWRNSRVIIVPKAQALGIRKLTSNMSTWKKGSELSDATDNLDESLAFGRKNLTPSYFTGAARLSRDLIRSSLIDIESLVYSEFARDLAEVIEQEDINGDGDGGPLGVMVASPDGISTARDVSSGSTTTTFTAESFYDAKYSMKVKYRNKCRWMFNRLIIRDIMKLRDDSGGVGTGLMMMQPALRAGEPDTLLGIPIDENEWFPSAKTTGAYYGLLAVWQHYIHAIALDMEILRLDQTRAKTNEIEYVGRVKLDGMPVLEEAFTRLQFATA